MFLSGKKENATCPIIVGDILDVKSLESAFAQHKPNLVIHTAAQVMLRSSLEDPVNDAMQNIIGTINVLELCKKYRVKKIIYTSTGGARYGQPEHLPVKESDPLHPLAPYGISKHTAEHYIEAYAKLTGMEYLILCFGNVYGPRDNPRNNRVITLFIEALLHKKTPMIFGDGEQTRDFLYVGDIAKVVKENIAATTHEKLFNVGSGESTSVNAIFFLVESELNTGLRPNYAVAIGGEIRDIVLDIALARKELGLQPTTIKQGIKETVAWYKKRVVVNE